MKPIIILPPDTMSSEDIKTLRDNELCVVVASNPAAVKFVDPIPAVSQRTHIEDAAIKLSRKVINPGFWNDSTTREHLTRAFVDILLKGTPLDPMGTQQEQEREIFNITKADELRRLAREEAKAERAAIKAKAQSEKK